ncbi:hypothetical protein [Flavonifractor plautii]
MANEPTVKLAANAMTTLEDTMERLGIPPEAADTAVKNNIIRLINSASAWIETITGRKFGKATYTHRYVAPGTQELVLTQYPIRTVEYVRDTEHGVSIDPSSYDFTMTGDVGVLYRDEGWVFRGYIGGLANDYTAPRRYLEVKFTAGYVLPKDATEDEPSDLPEDIVAIVWGIAEQEFSILRNGAQGLAAFSISDVSWTFDKEPRASWMETLAHYMRW